MKRIWLYLLPALLVFPCLLFAQFESLPAAERQYLMELPFDSMRVDTLNEWAFQLEGAPAQQYAQLALAYAQKINYREGVSDSHVRLGIVAADAGDYERAEQYYRTSLRERLALKLTTKAASCYNLLGNLGRSKGHYETATGWYRQGLALMEKQQVHINTACLYNGLGDAGRLAGQYELADSAFRTCIRIYEQLSTLTNDEKSRRENMQGLASARLNMGAFLQDNLSRYQESRELLLKSLYDFQLLNNKVNIGKAFINLGNNAYYTGNLQDAENYYQQGLALKNDIKQADYFILLKNRGRIYLEQGLYDRAISDFQTSLDSFIALKNSGQVSATRFEVGNYYYERSDFELAVDYYKQALDSNLNDPIIKSQIFLLLPDALDQLGRTTEADTYRDMEKHFMEQLDATQTRSALKRLMVNRISRDAVIKRIEREEWQTEKIRGYGLLGLLVAALMLVSLAFYISRQKRRLAERNAEIASQQEELARQNEQIAIQEKLDLLKNRELETNYARLAGQDEMQKKIGQELHDGVGALLTSAKLNLAPVDEVLDYLSEDKRRLYVRANSLLDEATGEVRRISHELGSAILMQFGLKAQLDALADVIAGSGSLRVELSTHGLRERLDYNTELNIYRIVQELVHNVIKHARAKNLSIQVNRFEDLINIIVEDDGRGFDAGKVQKKSGLGLQNLTARVHELRGTLHIDSRPGRGTIVSIDIPVNKTP